MSFAVEILCKSKLTYMYGNIYLYAKLVKTWISLSCTQKPMLQSMYIIT